MESELPFLGCIADDFTGATDLGSMLVRGGLRCVQWLGIPSGDLPTHNVDAIVISLKSRSTPADSAVRESLAALEALKAAGCERFFFKYCSTFDSTPGGNIGPVAEALADALGSSQVIFCPAFPENDRTVYQGHLFVGESLLSESGMEHHPLNPMTDANLVRVLSGQSRRTVGLGSHAWVREGASGLRAHLQGLSQQGTPLVIADATGDSDLEVWAEAVGDQPLVTGGSAIGKALADYYRRNGLVDSHDLASRTPPVNGHSAILSGSCSAATQRQVAHFAEHRPVYRIDPRRIAVGEPVAQEAVAWAADFLASGPVLIASTASPDEVEGLRAEFGDQLSRLVESLFAEVASELVERDVHRLIVAGGETAGAVLSRLRLTALLIGPLIDPGVPWTETLRNPKMAIALKSGNFGGDDFFLRALEMLP